MQISEYACVCHVSMLYPISFCQYSFCWSGTPALYLRSHFAPIFCLCVPLVNLFILWNNKEFVCFTGNCLYTGQMALPSVCAIVRRLTVTTFKLQPAVSGMLNGKLSTDHPRTSRSAQQKDNQGCAANLALCLFSR